MPEDKMEAITVYTIRSAKPRPDGKAKNELLGMGETPGTRNR